MADAVINFSLPEDNTCDTFALYTCATETGTYSLDATEDYVYGTTTMKIEDISATTWYKIKISSTVTDWETALSDPIYGGDFDDRSSPFLAISTTYDGVNYASTSEVYAASGLSSDECSVANCQVILRSTRAYIDIRLGDLGIGHYSFRNTQPIARQQYNGHLRVLRDCEINLAISTIMQQLANESQLELVTYDTAGGGASTAAIKSVSIGKTQIDTDPDVQAGKPDRLRERVKIFTELSEQYTNKANHLLKALMPTSIDLNYNSIVAKSSGTISGALIEPVEYSWAINGYISNTVGI